MSDILMTSHAAGSMQTFGKSYGSASRVAAEWLCFAAAPTFAVMALLIAVDGSQQDVLCAAMQHVAAWRNGSDVFADDCFSFGALAEADLTRTPHSQPSGLIGARKRAA
jgi:hypothetical protein